MITFTGHIITQDKEEKEKFEKMGIEGDASTEIEEFYFNPKDITAIIGNVTKINGTFYPVTDIYFNSGFQFTIAASKNEVLYAWKNINTDYTFNCTIPE